MDSAENRGAVRWRGFGYGCIFSIFSEQLGLRRASRADIARFFFCARPGRRSGSHARGTSPYVRGPPALRATPSAPLCPGARRAHHPLGSHARGPSPYARGPPALRATPGAPLCPRREPRAKKKNALCPLSPHSAVPVAQKKSKKYIHSRNRFPRPACVLQRRRSFQPRPARSLLLLRAASSSKRAVNRCRAPSDMESCSSIFSIFCEPLGRRYGAGENKPRADPLDNFWCKRVTHDLRYLGLVGVGLG